MTIVNIEVSGGKWPWQHEMVKGRYQHYCASCNGAIFVGDLHYSGGKATKRWHLTCAEKMRQEHEQHLKEQHLRNEEELEVCLRHHALGLPVAVLDNCNLYGKRKDLLRFLAKLMENLS